MVEFFFGECVVVRWKKLHMGCFFGFGFGFASDGLCLCSFWEKKGHGLRGFFVYIKEKWGVNGWMGKIPF